MTRLPDWEERLSAYLESAFNQPYADGQNDCLLHCGRAVEAVTGVDHYSRFVGRYATKRGALAVMKRLGGDTPEQVLDTLFPERPLGFAQRGDLVLTPDGVPGVSCGEFAVIVGSDGEREGLIRIPRILWTKAWAI